MVYDVVIIGGSYAGLQAALTLGRSLKNVLVIDSGKPCNRQAPYSHNFLTQDGQPPAVIASVGREQLVKYGTVKLLPGKAVGGLIIPDGFSITTKNGDQHKAKKLLFTSGIYDQMPDIPGFADCWGVSVIHCPYCHGYEVRSRPTGIIANGDAAYEYVKMISNWSNDITLFTNGLSLLSNKQTQKIISRGVKIVETPVESFIHQRGQIKQLLAGGGHDLDVVYTRLSFKQHCDVPQLLGCNLTDAGYIEVNEFHQTNVAGVYAAGDCITPMRSVAIAVSGGAFAGTVISKELIDEAF